jgi:hypothetical protein
MSPRKIRGKVSVASQEDSKESKSKTNAGFAGAGGGTLIAVFASQLPDDSPAKNLLIYSLVLSSVQ